MAVMGTSFSPGLRSGRTRVMSVIRVLSWWQCYTIPEDGEGRWGSHRPKTAPPGTCRRSPGAGGVLGAAALEEHGSGPGADHRDVGLPAAQPAQDRPRRRAQPGQLEPDPVASALGDQDLPVHEQGRIVQARGRGAGN